MYESKHKMLLCTTGLMITTNHWNIFQQIKHLSGQTKFGQTNFYYNNYGNIIEFTKKNKCLDNFQSLSYISTVTMETADHNMA